MGHTTLAVLGSPWQVEKKDDFVCQNPVGTPWMCHESQDDQAPEAVEFSCYSKALVNPVDDSCLILSLMCWGTIHKNPELHQDHPGSNGTQIHLNHLGQVDKEKVQKVLMSFACYFETTIECHWAEWPGLADLRANHGALCNGGSPFKCGYI